MHHSDTSANVFDIVFTTNWKALLGLPSGLKDSFLHYVLETSSSFFFDSCGQYPSPKPLMTTMISSLLKEKYLSDLQQEISPPDPQEDMTLEWLYHNPQEINEKYMFISELSPSKCILCFTT